MPRHQDRSEDTLSDVSCNGCRMLLLRGWLVLQPWGTRDLNPTWQRMRKWAQRAEAIPQGHTAVQRQRQNSNPSPQPQSLGCCLDSKIPVFSTGPTRTWGQEGTWGDAGGQGGRAVSTLTRTRSQTPSPEASPHLPQVPALQNAEPRLWSHARHPATPQWPRARGAHRQPCLTCS